MGAYVCDERELCRHYSLWANCWTGTKNGEDHLCGASFGMETGKCREMCFLFFFSPPSKRIEGSPQESASQPASKHRNEKRKIKLCYSATFFGRPELIGELHKTAGCRECASTEEKKGGREGSRNTHQNGGMP